VNMNFETVFFVLMLVTLVIVGVAAYRDRSEL